MVRVVAAADFASGISGILPFGPYRYGHANLTVYLYRPPIGEWIGVDAMSRIDVPAIGATTTRLFGWDGLGGRAHQTLIIRQETAPLPGSVESARNSTP